MAKQYGRPVATFTYSRRITKIRPGKTRVLKLRGKRVKVYLEQDGRTLIILEAPKELARLLKQAKKVKIEDGRLRPIVEKPKKETPKEREEKSKEELKKKPIPKPIEKKPEPKPAPAPQKPKPPKRKETPRPLSPTEREKAKLVPVPDKGPIPAPYIDWDAIPPYCMVRGVEYYDYSTPQAPKGIYHHVAGGPRENFLTDLAAFLDSINECDIIAVSAGFDRHEED